MNMNFFWLPEPPSPFQSELLAAVLQAHAQSAVRGNISSTVLLAAAQGSGSLTQSLAAALSTLGGLHAPIVETFNFIGEWEHDTLAEHVGHRLEWERKIPGWGNSFHKGEPDPLWLDVDDLLSTTFIGGVLGGITEILHRHGKNLYPNPSAYTAAAAIELGMPAQLAPWLLVAGRIQAWTHMFHLSSQSNP